ASWWVGVSESPERGRSWRGLPDLGLDLGGRLGEAVEPRLGAPHDVGRRRGLGLPVLDLLQGAAQEVQVDPALEEALDGGAEEAGLEGVLVAQRGLGAAIVVVTAGSLIEARPRPRASSAGRGSRGPGSWSGT